MPLHSLQQTFDLATHHHAAGRLAEAEKLYRQILAQQPDNIDTLRNLATLAHQTGRDDIATDLLRRVIALSPTHNTLGTVLKSLGQANDAIAAHRMAIDLRPHYFQAHNNLGIALAESKQFDAAVAAFSRAVALQPKFPEAHNNLGNALKDMKQFEESIAAYRRAIALSSNYAEAHANLGIALQQKGDLDAAVTAYRRALALDPAYADAHYNLGVIFRDRGDLPEAVAAFRSAIALKPDYAAAHNALGIALTHQGRLQEAIAAYRRAIDSKPGFDESHYNLGVALATAGQTDAAAAAYREAIALNPGNTTAHNNLANLLAGIGNIDEAIAMFRRLLVIAPSYSKGHGNLLYTILFHPGYDVSAIAAENRDWDLQHAQPIRKFIRPHSNTAAPDRRLRVGYVSPDFREHVVGRNLEPLLEHQDRQQFEIYCYANVRRPDAMTAKFQQLADCWRDIQRLSDEEVAEQIRQDGIDLLIDLTLHMEGSRLLVFARKPAPVQVTYLGYAGSTGLTAIDYRISDPHFDPPGTDLSCYSEKTIRLPRSYWCFRSAPAPDPSPPPAFANRFVTFGCLNNFAKVSAPALNLWARILLAVPGSHLILHAPLGQYLDGVTQRLEKAGVSRERVRFVGRQSWPQYAQTYSQIDIALDPFPYGGGITTCDALWMGVPVVSLSGQTAVGRGGRSILCNLGLHELIASTPDEYAKIAIDLSNNLDRRVLLRHSMRARMLASPLMDAPGFARDMETAYRKMWHAWCTKEPRAQ